MLKIFRLWRVVVWSTCGFLYIFIIFFLIRNKNFDRILTGHSYFDIIWGNFKLLQTIIYLIFFLFCTCYATCGKLSKRVEDEPHPRTVMSTFCLWLETMIGDQFNKVAWNRIIDMFCIDWINRDRSRSLLDLWTNARSIDVNQKNFAIDCIKIISQLSYDSRNESNQRFLELFLKQKFTFF